MRQGHLSKYFEGVAAKRLSAVEIRPTRSNQHEFNGVQPLKRLLGTDRKTIPARFLYLGEDEDDFVAAEGPVTWYDSRENHPSRSEHRLYYQSTIVSEVAREGDLLVIGKRSNGELLVLIAAAGTTAESQIQWLFSFDLDKSGNFSVVKIEGSRDAPLGIAAKFVLEELEIELEPETDFLELILNQFPPNKFASGFPPTEVFSTFARKTLKGVSPRDDPDGALIAWMEREEVLFRALEQHLVVDRISKGFGSDVNAFISFSLSVQNRRKARAGLALEHHIERILNDHGLKYSRGAITEGGSRPDFLFPGAREYHDHNFSNHRLRMLAVKSSCKERWQQVLAEADRIKNKHLLTLEPSISENQTTKMDEKSLRLVLPKSLHATYASTQRRWLLTVSDFVLEMKTLQSKAQ